MFNYLSRNSNFEIHVIYTLGQNNGSIYDHGFQKDILWDIDLLDGYSYSFSENISRSPGSSHFFGIINPDLIPKIILQNPDAIIIYGWKFESHLKVIRHFKRKVPLIFRGDSTLLDKSFSFGLKTLLRKYILKWVYGNIDYVLSPGSSSDDYFKCAGLKSYQIHRALHAIDNDRFIGKSTCEFDLKAKNWRQELGIPRKRKVFLFAGKFESKKDPIILIESFALLLKKESEIHLILVGNGEMENEIKDQVDGLSLSLYVTILPFQNQSLMPIVYRLGDVFILPSKGPGETWGLSMNEAMASGRPVIASDKCGGTKDLIIDGLNGYSFKAGDKYDLLQKMEMMLAANTNAMGENARVHVSQFNYNDFLTALEKIVI